MRFDSILTRSSLRFGLLLSLLPGCPMEGSDDDHTGDDAGMLAAYSIHGVVTRADAAPPSGDGVGTLWIAVLSECSLGAELAGAAVVPDADLSAAGVPVAFEAAELPPGDYHLALFLDDDGSADPMMPTPSPGDLVYADGVGDGMLSCVPVTVDDEDVEGLALVLNAVVPGSHG